MTKFVRLYEKEFAQLMMGFSQKAAADEMRTTLRELDAAIYRDKELDGLFERLYEDNVAGKITDERFARMSSKYEAEQKELREKIKALQDAVERTKSKAVTADMFISAVRKYTRARKLRPRMLNELIEKSKFIRRKRQTAYGSRSSRSITTASASSLFRRPCRSPDRGDPVAHV